MRCRAFTLLEVVIAVGVFAVGVVGILALLPALGREIGSSADERVAQGLPDALRIELRRMADRGGFDALAARVPVMTPSLSDGLPLVAPRSGEVVQSAGYLPPAENPLPEAEQYYLLEVWRFANAPLAYAPERPVLPLHVRVSWPHRSPGRIAPVSSAGFAFNLAISR